MNAEKLRQIQAALTREFTNPTTAPCTPQRVHLVYAHVAALVDARTLLPLDYPDFESRVDAWNWPTTQRYEACGVIKHNLPYRDFIRARFLWKERAGVRITQLPANADPADPTAADGGTLIVLHDGTSLGAGAQATRVRIELPAQENVPDGYPSIRRVCLSIPGQEGQHGEVNTPDAPGNNAVTLEYPGRDREAELHLIAEVPWFRFEYPRGTRVTQDPWTFKINYSITPATHRGRALYEAASGTEVGSIMRYSGHFGLGNSGEDSKSDVRGGYGGNLSNSRRLVLAAVMNVEGGPAAVSSYDGPKASWGMNQWTWPGDGATSGELHQILCYVYDFFPEAWDRCFGRYGLGMSFTSRARTWDAHSTYGQPILFRVPCCRPNGQNPSIRTGLNNVGQNLQRDQNHRTIATAYRITDRSDTTSIAFLFLLHKAGLDTDIQRAQVQWTSYRISSGLRGNRNPTNDDALRGFLTSLGSNMPAADRLANANAGIAAGRAEGHTYPALNARFNDDGTTEEWRDWAVRCDNAGKETTPPRAQNQRPAVQLRPQARP